MMSKQFEKEYDAAKRQAAWDDDLQPRAKGAGYDKRSRRIVVDLRSGARFIFPADLAQGLAGASDAALSNIEVSASGIALRWPDLDADFSLPSLMAGVFGTRAWMRELARQQRTPPKRRDCSGVADRGN